MRLFFATAVTLALISTATMAKAEAPRQPGQIADDSNQATAGRVIEPSQNFSGAMPKTTIASPEDTHDRVMNRLWITSIAALVAATSLDAATSWGKREGNSLLASSDGRFGAKGLSIKAGTAAAVLVPEILWRKHKDLKPAFAAGNLAEASIFAGVSVHNLQVREAASH
jgi:hypothetical protein